jgi:hypothetical protein
MRWCGVGSEAAITDGRGWCGGAREAHLLPLMDRRVPMLTSRTNSGWPVHTPAGGSAEGGTRGRASAARRKREAARRGQKRAPRRRCPPAPGSARLLKRKPFSSVMTRRSVCGRERDARRGGEAQRARGGTARGCHQKERRSENWRCRRLAARRAARRRAPAPHAHAPAAACPGAGTAPRWRAACSPPARARARREPAAPPQRRPGRRAARGAPATPLPEVRAPTLPPPRAVAG